MPVGETRAREIPDEEAFKLWLELNTQRKVSQHLARKGIINTATGNPYHPQSVYQACIRYILEHMSEARQMIIDSGREFAEDDERWLDYTVRKAYSCYSMSWRKFVEWMHRNNLKLRDYKYLYEDFYDILLGVYNRRYPDEKQE
jgi:hypothetical protein